jgi:hypothetical protein
MGKQKAASMRKATTEAGSQRVRPKKEPHAADRAKLLAARHCLLNYPTLYTAGTPHGDGHLWNVPIVATHPERGVLAEVGELTVDLRRGCVVTATSRAAVVSAGERFYK